jgi:hypothetical protein
MSPEIAFRRNERHDSDLRVPSNTAGRLSVRIESEKKFRSPLPSSADFLSRRAFAARPCYDLHFRLTRRRLDASAPAAPQCVAWPGWLDGDYRSSLRLSPRQRSFNWQSTAFVMRGLSVRLRPLALPVGQAPEPDRCVDRACALRTVRSGELSGKNA